MPTSSQRPPTLAATIALNIKAELDARGWNFARLSREADIPASIDAIYWADASNILIEDLVAFAEALGVRPSDLLRDVPADGVRPCPSWCTLPTDHDLGEQPMFDPKKDARIHYPPVSSDDKVIVAFNDNPYRPKNMFWEAEVIGLQMQEDTPTALAAELRRAGAELVAAAEWLEARG